MALARTLKMMNLYNEGTRYIGEVLSVTLPPLTRIMEEYRPGGLDGTVEIDMGAGPMRMEWTCGGPMRDVLRQYGVTTLAGVFLRFAGGFQNDETGSADSIEVTVRGRHQEIAMGEQKVGEMGSFNVNSALVYYRLDWNGRTEIEIDVLNNVFIVNGFDRLAALRAAVE